MAHVIFDQAGNVSAVFGSIQENSVEISDDDARLLTFHDSKKKDAANASIFMQLAQIDAKSIRALREGNSARIGELESQAAALRLQLVK